ncbi:uncharacterized protein LOC118205158 [Stegodyphus dumicola]|uniref:uncharacterized protein LOC118205158 n=1 Tax=Stegodyphus dumicola TaxID=202533 RepID=UPI0015AB5CD2|nr:uncharacterized protein LOC118205158 [Stegodyphus dumicola]
MNRGVQGQRARIPPIKEELREQGQERSGCGRLRISCGHIKRLPWRVCDVRQSHPHHNVTFLRRCSVVPIVMIILRNLNLSHYAKIVKKLRKTAVPTLFSIPNPPPSVTDKRIREVRCPKPNTEVETLPASNEELLKKIEFLEQQLQEKDAKLTSFLSDEQVGTLAVQSKRNWSEKSIIKGLKMRFALEQTWI